MRGAAGLRLTSYRVAASARTCRDGSPSQPIFRGLLGTGDATLFDSRLLHCGGANESPRRRALFYVSFRARKALAPPGSLLYALRERYSLRELRERCSTSRYKI